MNHRGADEVSTIGTWFCRRSFHVGSNIRNI
jgi:hypothetical protein